MKHRSVFFRLSVVFVTLLVTCSLASGWLQVRSSERHEQEITQRLSARLAGHIANHAALMEPGGLDQLAVRDLFGKLMDVNPSAEVYVLGPDGRVQAHAAPAGHLRRERVDLRPVDRLLAGEPLPILGDDPRSESGRKVFSAAALTVAGRPVGYVYVVLMGEDRDTLARALGNADVLRTTLWSMTLVAVLGAVAGVAAFRWITRPLRQLTQSVHRLQADGPTSADATVPQLPWDDVRGDEITVLRGAFAQMSARIAAQWRELSAQDRQRRELVATISHDLRTPLTSLHGYLETLRIKADQLSRSDRERYLDIALGQSTKVGRLAQELFELARLEYGAVRPAKERFSLAELLQDVLQKFELAAQPANQRLLLDVEPSLPAVSADVGLIERVLTNLLDNAIRHTPRGGWVKVRVSGGREYVSVRICDSGPGVPSELRAALFERPTLDTGKRSGGGLGLVIVRRILRLHGSDIRLLDEVGAGAVFEFRLGTFDVEGVTA